MKRRLLALALVAILLLFSFPVKTAAVPFGDCLAYDDFNRANGSIGATQTTGPYGSVCPALNWGWASSNWFVTSSAATGTPTIGTNQVVNGTFDSDTGWSKGTNVTIHDGAVYVAAPGSETYTYNSGEANSSTGTWYQSTYDIGNYSAGTLIFSIDGIANDVTKSAAGSYLVVIRSRNNGKNYLTSNSTAQYSVDNITRKPITLNTLFSTVNLSTSNVIANVNITSTPYTQAGLILNLDSSSTPANFLIAYTDGINVKLDKNVSGTYTPLIFSGVTYVAGATLQVTTTRSGSDLLVDVKYNGATVGTQQTVSDAGIVNNTLAGLFSTYSTNSFDNFYVTSNTANTPTPTNTATFTNTFTPSNTPTHTPTKTHTPTETYTPSDTPTETPTETYTPTETFTPTFTFTFTPTDTPTITNTPTETPTWTSTPIYNYIRDITSGDVLTSNIMVIGFIVMVAISIVIVGLLIFRRSR